MKFGNFQHKTWILHCILSFVVDWISSERGEDGKMDRVKGSTT